MEVGLIFRKLLFLKNMKKEDPNKFLQACTNSKVAGQIL